MSRGDCCPFARCDAREAVGSLGVVLRLPEPMLAHAESIPGGAAWMFEPKLDGFRCLVCTHDGFRAGVGAVGI